jgi:hypothetical protein
MKHIISLMLAAVTAVTLTASADTKYQSDAQNAYQWMTGLQGEWILSPADRQVGKATKHKLVAPIVGTDTTAMSFRLVGKGSTVQENLLPGNKKEMVTMYHCQDVGCDTVKATHYCAKKNQPEMTVELASASNALVFNCDMKTTLCKSNEDHVHKITHQLSDNGRQLTTTYTSWKDGKYLKDSVYKFERK